MPINPNEWREEARRERGDESNGGKIKDEQRPCAGRRGTCNKFTLSLQPSGREEVMGGQAGWLAGGQVSRGLVGCQKKGELVRWWPIFMVGLVRNLCSQAGTS